MGLRYGSPPYGFMERREAVGWGLALGGVAHLYYTPFVFAFSTVEAAVTAVMAVGLLQTAAGFGAGDPWGAAVGAVTAGLASLWNVQDLLAGVASVWTVGGVLEGAGLVLLAAAMVAWSWPRDEDADPPVDRADAVQAFRAACGVSVASTLVYAFANLTVGNPLILPGNLLALAGFGYAAWRARLPLFEGDPDPEDREGPEASELEPREGGRPT